MPIPVCLPLSSAQDALATMIRTPGGAQIRAVRDVIRGLPDPSRVIGNFFGQLDTALTPFRTFIMIAQFVQAVNQCATAAQTAITSLDPTALTDCVQNLIESIARLLGVFPPFSYFLLFGDVLHAMIVYLDQVIQALTDLDARISTIAAARATAQTLNDPALTLIADCAQADVTEATANTLGALEIIGATMGIVISTVRMFADVFDFEGADTAADGINATLAAPETGVLTSLQAILNVASALRTALLAVYGVLSTAAGLDPAVLEAEIARLRAVSAPTFSNP